MSTTEFWTRYWFWWLLVVLVSWLVMEGVSIAVARRSHQPHFQVWTLSDTIRRWSVAHRWLGPLAVGTFAMLGYHFFVQANL